MDNLDERILRLIAIGASVAANCQVCLQTNVARALQCGAGEQEIAAAITTGKKVRQGAAAELDQFTTDLGKTTLPSTYLLEGCGCH